MTFVYHSRGEGKQIQDEALVQRILAGDESAFRELVCLYRLYVYQTIYAIVRHAKDAEDLSQEVWIRVYFSLPGYQSKGLKAWISRIAVNKAIDFKRSAYHQKVETAAEIEEPPEAHALKSLEQAVAAKETVELVRSRLEEIPVNYQDVLMAYYLQNKSYQDIADDLGVTVKTVESKLYRAKQWLRKHWKEEDFT